MSLFRTAIAAATIVLTACAPSIPSDFAGSYAAIDATRSCSERTQSTVLVDRYGGWELTIELDEHDQHTVQMPMIDCPVRGAVEDDQLRFPSQDCSSGLDEQVDINGIASWTDDDALAIELESTAIWPPHAEYWPDGLVWDCEHSFLLERVED